MEMETLEIPTHVAFLPSHVAVFVGSSEKEGPSKFDCYTQDFKSKSLIEIGLVV